MRLCSSSASKTPAASGGGWSYVAFAKANPIANNLMIATLKTAAADLLVQSAIERKSVSEIDWKRTSVFALFGFV
jgi:Flp pilus assembly protein CpaB